MNTDYLVLADKLRATRIISDPWLEGEPRFLLKPELLGSHTASHLAHAATAVVSAFNEMVQLAAADESIIDAVGLSPHQRMMWHASQPLWHGIARADVFRTKGGHIQVCELNSDTPSGEAEAVLLNDALWQAPYVNPNERLELRFCRMLESMTAHLVGKQLDSVGIVYPTEMTEDLSLVALYQRWFEARGWQVTLGSPYNLARDSAGRLTLFGKPCDAIVRHYKTDWWSEREGAWDDSEPIADAEPLDAPLAAILGAALDGKVAVINPFGSVFTQNKRTMALLWERRASLSPAAWAAVEQYIPFTMRLETCLDELHKNRSDWVLKSDYGCEGDEVIIGRATDRETWEASLAHALPKKWIAQRYFEAEARDDGTHVNYGVYVIGGEPAGFFSRVQASATDAYAMTAATFLERESTA